MKHAWIISIGTELTLGQCVDTNSAWLSRRLAALGIRAVRHVTVSDDLVPTRDALREAAAAADLVLVTGGLGPTEDDLTRQALAEAAGVPLELDGPSVEQVRAFFTRRGREMPDVNRRQALRPAGARCIENTCGTAPGIAMTLRGTPVYGFPGVPSEMRTMFDRDVAPHLKAATAGRAIHSLTLQTFGLGESQIGEMLADLMTRDRNPEVGTTAQLGIVGVRINATAESAAAASDLAEQAATEIAARLGHVVFGREGVTLASVAGGLLRERRRTLALAESCTGGLIAKLLTDIAGSSDYFLGGVVSYANSAKGELLGVDERLLAAHGAVSAPVAEAMATGARSRLSADFALAVTGIAGPGGGSDEKPVGLVFIALANPLGVESRRFLFGGDAPREVIRQRAALSAIDMLRLHLLRRT